MNPYGKDFSWVYDNYSPILGRHLISVQWLRWQGAEYSLAYIDKHQRDEDLASLKKIFAPDYPTSVHMYASDMGGLSKDFECDLTLTPEQLIENLDNQTERFEVWLRPFPKSYPILRPVSWWLASKPLNNDNRSLVGPFDTKRKALDYQSEFRPRNLWESILLAKGKE